MQEEKKILTELASMGELIAVKRLLKLTENHEVNLIAENAFSGVRETNKIRELYRVICEITEKGSECEIRKNQEIETEWEMLE